MKRASNFAAILLVAASAVALAQSNGVLSAQSFKKTASRDVVAGSLATQACVETKIFELLDQEKPVYVSLPKADCRALGEGFDSSDGAKRLLNSLEAQRVGPSTHVMSPGFRRSTSYTKRTGSSNASIATISTETLTHCDCKVLPRRPKNSRGAEGRDRS